MNDALKRIKKLSNNDFAFSLSDKNNPYVVTDYIDTGCYVLNAVVGNGDIYSGIPLGKRITLAGPSSTAKSFFAAHIIKSYLESDPDHNVIFFESEGSSISEMADSLGIDKDRIIVLPVTTVEEFRTQSVNILDGIMEEQKEKKDNNSKYLLVLDSIGMLASEKEYKDALEDKQSVDMTRAKVIKSVFRLLTLKLSLAKTSLITIAHTYQCIDGQQEIQMADGSFLNIKDIDIGMEVKTLYGNKKILDTVEHEIDTYIELELEDGKIIKCTPNHKFMVDGVWTEAIDIQKNDNLDVAS